MDSYLAFSSWFW